MTRFGTFEPFLAGLRPFIGFHCFCFHCQDFDRFLLDPPRSCLARGVINEIGAQVRNLLNVQIEMTKYISNVKTLPL